MDYGFLYIKDHGISLESEYPYKGKDQKCLKQTNQFKIKGFIQVHSSENDELLEALNIEPISVGV